MVFFRRSPRGNADSDVWLRVKMWLFALGAVLALIGMGLDNGWVMGAAALVLAGGVALRFIPPRRPLPPPDS